jgi:PEP-CTERM motif
MVAGDSLTTTNLNLVLNAIDTYTIAPPPPTAIPEPSTWAMMVLGFVGLGFAGYRVSRRTPRVA